MALFSVYLAASVLQLLGDRRIREQISNDPIGHRLTGDRTGKVYRLGDAIRVRVAAVNIDDRKIDFVLAEKQSGSGEETGEKPKKSRKSRSRSRSRSRKDEDRGEQSKKSGSRGRSRSRSKRRT